MLGDNCSYVHAQLVLLHCNEGVHQSGLLVWDLAISVLEQQLSKHLKITNASTVPPKL